MSVIALADLDPVLQPWAESLLSYGGAWGVQPRITSVLRTHSQQLRLWLLYRAGRSSYPAAPPGRSSHEYGLAFDIVTSPMDALVDLGALWQSWGGTWGGASDPVHFEAPGASEWLRSLSVDDILTLSAGIDPSLVASADPLGGPPSGYPEPIP